MNSTDICTLILLIVGIFKNDIGNTKALNYKIHVSLIIINLYIIT